MTNLLPNSARPGSAKTFAGVLTVAATMLIASCAFGFVAWAAAPWGLAGIWAAISAMMVVRTAGAALGISRLRTMAASAA